MSDVDKSLDNADVSEDTNDKSNDASIVDTSNNNQNNKEDEKKYSDKDYNDFVKRKSAELEARLKAKHDKSLEGKHVLSDEELEQQKKDYATTAISEHVRSESLKTNRATYKGKGLTEAQLDAIEKQLDKPEDYTKVADELFGALLKKEPPIINSGNTNTKTSDTTDVDDLIGKSLEAFRNRK